MIMGFSYKKGKKCALTSYVSFFTKSMKEKERKKRKEGRRERGREWRREEGGKSLKRGEIL